MATDKSLHGSVGEPEELGAIGGEDQIGQTVDDIDEKVSLAGRRLRRPNTLKDEESVRTEKALALKRSCAGHLSRLTRLYGELKALTRDVHHLQQVLEKRKGLDIAFDKFKKANDLYVEQLNEPVDILNAQDAYEVQVREYSRCISELELWIQNVQTNDELSNVRPSDSISQTGSAKSRRSSGSSRSHRSSVMKINEAKEKKELARLKLQQLEKMQALELKKLQVKGEEDTLKLQNEYEQAVLSERIWDEVKLTLYQGESLVQESSSRPVVPKEGECLISTLPGRWATATNKDEVSFIRDINPPIDMPTQGVTLPRPQGPVRIVKSEEEESFDNGLPEMDGLRDFTPHPKPDEQGLLRSVAYAMNEGFNMPKPELITFDGNPLNYWRFVTNFETNIANETRSARKRLGYLIQHCEGEAREAIEDCIILDPEVGYKKAREILLQQFGRPHVVAQSHIKLITGGQPIKPMDGSELLKLARQMQNCELTLVRMGWAEDLNNSETLLRIIDRLPQYMQMKWANQAEAILKLNRRPRFSDLTKFVQDKADVANNMFSKHISESRKKIAKDKVKGRMNDISRGSTLMIKDDDYTKQGIRDPPGTNTKARCLLCSRWHKLGDCEEFKKKTYEERLQIVRQNKICNNCFKSGHYARGCLERKSCELPECRRKHHTLLHPPRQEQPKDSEDNKDSTQTEVTGSVRTTQYNVPRTSARKVCLRIVPVMIQGTRQNKAVKTYALLDSGSDVSLCDRRLLERLGLEGVKRKFSLTTLNGERQERNGKEVELQVTDLDGNETISMPKVWSVEKLPVSDRSFPKQEDVRKWSHLEGLEFPSIEDREVQLLIGGDVPDAFWVMDERRGNHGEPYAIKSPLGWTLVGPVINSKEEKDFSVNFVRLEDDQLQHQLEKFWKTDFGDSIMDNKKSMSIEDQRALKIMEETATKIEGHYQVGLPWRMKPPCFPNNRSLAESRDEQLRAKYMEVVNGYITKGYARKIPDDELRAEGNSTWYLPHHAVVHPHKPGKVRVVFDCAAKFKGTSLNEHLLRGPDLTNNLVGVLIRFRKEPIAIVSDIEAMFHQVLVSPNDRNALRFLWWSDNDLTKEPEDHQMRVHIFGATSSPSCTSFCLKKTAQDNSKKFDAEIVKTLRRTFTSMIV